LTTLAFATLEDLYTEFVRSALVRLSKAGPFLGVEWRVEFRDREVFPAPIVWLLLSDEADGARNASFTDLTTGRAAAAEAIATMQCDGMFWDDLEEVVKRQYPKPWIATGATFCCLPDMILVTAEYNMNHDPNPPEDLLQDWPSSLEPMVLIEKPFASNHGTLAAMQLLERGRNLLWTARAFAGSLPHQAPLPDLPTPAALLVPTRA
jgi:hypothetical protein